MAKPKPMWARVPNALAVLRMGLSAAIPFFASELAAFCVLVLLAGLTDVADGYVARRYHAVSALGARLDSIADGMLFAAVLLSALLFYSEAILGNLVLLLAIVGVRLSSMTLGLIRHKDTVFIHTYLNKAAGFALILAVPFDLLVPGTPAVAVALWLALLAAIEELAIMIAIEKPDADLKSILHATAGSRPAKN